MYIHDATCTGAVCLLYLCMCMCVMIVSVSVPYVCLIHCVCVCTGPSEAVTAGCEGRLSTAPVQSEFRREETTLAGSPSFSSASFLISPSFFQSRENLLFQPDLLCIFLGHPCVSKKVFESREWQDFQHSSAEVKTKRSSRVSYEGRRIYARVDWVQ